MMRNLNLKLAVLFIIGSGSPLMSQNEGYFDSEIKSVNQQSANKTFSNVNQSSGTLNTSIPLGTISAGGAQVPITLFYSRTGRTISETDGDLALGWQISYGGEVNCIPQGEPDFTPREGIHIGPADCNFGGSFGNYAEENNLYNISSDPINQELDAFSYSLFGASGQFYYKSYNNFDVTSNVVQIPMTNNLFTTYGGFNYSLLETDNSIGNFCTANYSVVAAIDSLKIRNGNRTVYSFTPNGRVYLDVGDDDLSWCEPSLFDGDSYINKYKLSRIHDLDNNTLIQYEYFPACYAVNADVRKGFKVGGFSQDYQIETLKNVQTEKLIKKIKSDKISVEFLRSENDDREITNIKFLNAYGIPIKIIEFVYTEESLFSYNLEKTRFLTKLIFKTGTGEVISEMNFDYIDLSPFEQNNFRAQDYWGYFNGEYGNSSLFTAYTFNVNPFIDQVNRISNFDRTLEGMLNTVSTSTGKSEHYTYELNDYGTEVGNDQATIGDYYQYKKKEFEGLEVLSIVEEEFKLTNTTNWTNINFTNGIQVTGNQSVVLRFDIEDSGIAIPHTECNVCKRLQIICTKVGDPNFESLYEELSINLPSQSHSFQLPTGEYNFKIRRIKPVCSWDMEDANCSNMGSLQVSIKYKSSTERQKDVRPKMGGLRVKKISVNDGNGSLYSNHYQYRQIEDTTLSSGVLILRPEFSIKLPVDVWAIVSAFDENPFFPTTGIIIEDIDLLFVKQIKIEGHDSLRLMSTEIVTNYFNTQRSPVFYTSVSNYKTGFSASGELVDGREVIGWTESKFSYNPEIYSDLEFPFSQYFLKDWENGNPTETNIYDADNALVSKSTIAYDYIRDSNGDRKVYNSLTSTPEAKSRYLFVNPGYADYHGITPAAIDDYWDGDYPKSIESFKYTQVESQSFEYANGEIAAQTTTLYNYSNDEYGLLSSSETTDLSGEKYINHIKYVKDFSTSGTASDNQIEAMQILKDNNLDYQPILSYATRGQGSSEIFLGGTCILYDMDDNSTIPFIKEKLQTKTISVSNYANLVEVVNDGGGLHFEYDELFESLGTTKVRNPELFPIEQTDEHDRSGSILVNEITGQVAAKINNGQLSTSRYTSFENIDYHGGWNPNLSNIINSTESDYALTGDKYYDLGNSGAFNSGTGGTNTALPSGKYLLSYWSKGNVITIYSNNGSELQSSSFIEGDWTYTEKIIEWESSTTGNFITIDGEANQDAYIDELRLHEFDATMLTTGYYNDGKVKYKCSSNGEVVTSQYDSKGRLEKLLDRQRFIIEQHLYDEKDITDVNSYNKHTIFHAKLDSISKTDITTAGSQVSKRLEFLDGLGRLMQSMDYRFTSAGLEKVTFTEHDDFGRELKKYLPYYTNLPNDQEFIEEVQSEQENFYLSQTDPNEQNTAPYLVTELENNPLQRPVETGGTSDELQPGNGHSTRTVYGWNTISDNIRKWEFDEASASAIAPTFYSDNALRKKTVTNPDGKTISTFTDERGLEVATTIYAKVQYDNTGRAYTSGESGTRIQVTSYAVYDVFERIVFEIPAKAMEELTLNGEDFYVSWYPSENHDTELIVAELITAYSYDDDGRLEKKRMPGNGCQYFIHNHLDRVVMSRDEQQIEEDKWNFVKYDTRGRTVLKGSGVISNDHNFHYNQMANHFDDNQEIIKGETFISESASGQLMGYSNLSYPHFIEEQLLTNVFYFDNYDFDYPSEFEYIVFNDITDPFELTRGLATGSKTRILNSDGSYGDWLTTVSYYDDKKRPIQEFTQNHKGGWDRIDSYYNDYGQLEKTIQRHKYDASSPEIQLRTRFIYYSPNGQIRKVLCKLGSDPEVTVSYRLYNDKGQLKNLKLHNGEENSNYLQNIDYRYNAQGNLTHINNTALIVDAFNEEDDDVFGQELSYFIESPEYFTPSGSPSTNDPHIITPQYGGNVSSMLWNAKTMEEDGTTLKRHAYVYRYDDLGNMTRALYGSDEPSNPGLFNKDKGYYNEILSYDLGGNITHLMRNREISVSSFQLPTIMDNITYSYRNNGYVPNAIQDSGESDFSPQRKHFVDNVNLTEEYIYDNSGRLLEDKNKGVSMEYNILGLPRTATQTSNSIFQIGYKYDAAGNKLQKATLNTESDPTSIHEKDYIGNFIYENGNLAMVYHPEGVIRPTPPDADNTTDYVYDYFIKDYLGNVRVVLTEENATYTHKFLATLEEVHRHLEENSFDNIGETAKDLPSGYPVDGSIELNKKIAYLSAANGTKIGPSMVLPVRHGDRVSLRTDYFYSEDSPGAKYDNLTMLVNEVLLALVASGSGILHLPESQLVDIATGAENYGSAVSAFFSNSFDTTDVTKPHAYLVWMLYDNQMKLLPHGSGAKRVTDPNSLEELLKEEITIVENGYLHAYVSNGSAAAISFDNFLVTHMRGTTRQINHYYPYGLSISGLHSDYDEYLDKYTSKELQTGEFYSATSSGLEMFDFGSRFYDPQVGRWSTPDPAEQFHNPYLAMGNNPVIYTDPNGESIILAALLGGYFMLNLQSLQGNVETPGDMLGAFAIGALSGVAGFGAGTLVKGGMGFIANAAQGATGGFAAGFVSGTGGALMGGADLGNGLLAGAKGAAIGGVSGAVLGGLSGGVKADNMGLDFWKGTFKTSDDALDFLKNALASKDGMLFSENLPQIDLGGDKISEEFRELFQYLNDNGASGFSIDELVDLNTHFDKTLMQTISDGFFDGGFGYVSNTLKIDFPNTNFSGSVRYGYWTDKNLISGGFTYGKTASWHSLRLSSSTGSYMLEISLSERSLYYHYFYTYMSMNSNNIR